MRTISYIFEFISNVAHRFSLDVKSLISDDNFVTFSSTGLIGFITFISVETYFFTILGKALSAVVVAAISGFAGVFFKDLAEAAKKLIKKKWLKGSKH